MPYETALASTLTATVIAGATLAAASVIAMQSMGIWIEPPGS